MTATKDTMTTDRDAGQGAAGRPLGPHERGVVVGTLLLIATLVAFDVGTDLLQGASGWRQYQQSPQAGAQLRIT